MELLARLVRPSRSLSEIVLEICAAETPEVHVNGLHLFGNEHFVGNVQSYF